MGVQENLCLGNLAGNLAGKEAAWTRTMIIVPCRVVENLRRGLVKFTFRNSRMAI
jgi:hypothetical protein